MKSALWGKAAGARRSATTDRDKEHVKFVATQPTPIIERYPGFWSQVQQAMQTDLHVIAKLLKIA
jgi:hypothetical protein